MKLNEFEELVGNLYDELPHDIKSRVQVFVEEIPCEFSKINKPFGYWTNLFPEAVTLCYWVFKDHGDFSKEHISRVLKHEIEHLLLTRYGIKHSEHGN